MEQERTPALVYGLAAAGVVALTGLQLLRQTGVPALDSIWAEDGAVFLDAAVNDGLSVIAEPQAGYIHLVPRLLAELASVIPLSYAPWVMSGLSALLVSCVAAYVFVASRRLIPSVVLRGSLATLTALLPLAGTEATANAANVHWYLTFAAFWALWWEPGSRKLEIFGGLICFLAAASDPLSMLLLPVAAALWIQRRRLPIPAVGLVVGFCIQTMAIVAEGVPSEPSSVGIFDLPYLYTLRVIAALVLGDRLLRELWGGSPAGVWVVGLALYASVAMHLVTKRGNAVFLGTTFLLSLLFLLVPLVTRDLVTLFPEPGGLGNGGNRYLIVPILLAYSAFARLLTVTTSPKLRWGLFVSLALALTLITIDFRVVNSRSAGPSWSEELQTATCDAEGVAKLEIAPEPFAVNVPCSRMAS